MTSSLTVSFSDNSSVLHSHFFPEIILDEDCDYSCALLDLIIKNINDAKLVEKINSNVINIECDIISGSYINGERKQIIHQFAASTSHKKGQTFVEIPKNLIYFPVKTKSLRSIHISIVDQKGEKINTSGADITCRINIKRDNKGKTN